MAFLRSKPFASTFFKTTGGPGTMLNGIPRYKFMYYAKFVPSGDAIAASRESGLNYPQLGTYQEGISFKINSIDKPKVEMTVQELNQYNRKRYAYTKLEYQPLNIKIFDTADDIPLKLWYDYFTYYFGDSRPKTGQSVHDRSVTEGRLDTMYGTTGFGLNPKGDRYNFFSRIELYALFGKRYTQIDYINPKISLIDWGNYENASSDPAEISMTLRYEAIEYKAIAAPITANRMAEFGFDIPNTLSVPGVQVPAPSVEVEGLARPTTDLREWIPDDEFEEEMFDLILARSRNALIPTDIALGVTAGLNLANSTLNLFSGAGIGAISSQAGLVIGQSGGGISLGLGTGIVNGQLLTNPAATSGYIGAGIAVPSLPNPLGSSIGVYGSFNFGSVNASGGIGVNGGFGAGSPNSWENSGIVSSDEWIDTSTINGDDGWS